MSQDRTALVQELQSLQQELEAMGNEFNSDGHIDDQERARLNNMMSVIEAVKGELDQLANSDLVQQMSVVPDQTDSTNPSVSSSDAVTTVEESSEVQEDSIELPEDFKTAFEELSGRLQSLKDKVEHCEGANAITEEENEVISREIEDIETNKSRLFNEPRMLLGNSTPEVVSHCNQLLEEQEGIFESVSSRFTALKAAIEEAREQEQERETEEVMLDQNMQALLDEHGDAFSLFNHLKGALERIKEDFNNFIESRTNACI